MPTPDWLDLIDDLADVQARDWYGSRADFRISDEQLDAACATCPDLAIEDGCTLFDASDLSMQQWRALAAVKADPVAIYNAGLSVIAAYRTAIRKEVRDTIAEAVYDECDRRRRNREWARHERIVDDGFDRLRQDRLESRL